MCDENVEKLTEMHDFVQTIRIRIAHRSRNLCFRAEEFIVFRIGASGSFWHFSGPQDCDEFVFVFISGNFGIYLQAIIYGSFQFIDLPDAFGQISA